MPLSKAHKEQTRHRIVECARKLFNRRGFVEVTIEEIMAAADLTRGGFYKHFDSKEELYEEVLVAYAEQRETAAATSPISGTELARYIVNNYVSRSHLDDYDGHCPLMALSSDASRSSESVRRAYQRVLESLVDVLSMKLDPQMQLTQRQVGLAAASTCVGAMVLARAVADKHLADEVCGAARAFANAAILQPEHD